MFSPLHSSAPPSLLNPDTGPPPTTPLDQRISQFQFPQPTPESRSTLELRRRRVEAGIRDTEIWLQENEASGCSRYLAERMDETINTLDQQLEEVMELYTQQLRTFPSPSGKRAASREALFETSSRWVRTARWRNWASVREAAPQATAPQHSAAHLERVKLPTFDGKAENWAEFKRRFQELIKAVNCSPVLEMTFLVDHLAAEAARYVLGVTNPTKAWALLDKRYGDRRLAILTTRYRLINLEVPRGFGYEKVEALVQGLRHARTCLEAVGAEDELFSDLAMVGILLSKLPSMVQEQWYRYRVTFPSTNSAREDGKYFEQWLDRQGEAATLERITLLGIQLAHPPSSNSREEEEEVLCPTCDLAGHRADSCPSARSSGAVPPPQDLRGGERMAGTYSTTTSPSTTTGSSLLDVATVSVHSPSLLSSTTTIMLTDQGSTDTFISHTLAQELQLPGTPTTLQVKVLGQPPREVATMVYKLYLEDTKGKKYRVEAVGMDSLTEVPPCPQASSLSHLFPGAPAEAAAAFTRPHGTVALLLGQRHRGLHTRDAGHQVDDLRLAKGKFGWTLTGYSPLLTTPAPYSSSNFVLATSLPSSSTPSLPSSTIPSTSTLAPGTSTRRPLRLRSGVYYCSCPRTL